MTRVINSIGAARSYGPHKTGILPGTPTSRGAKRQVVFDIDFNLINEGAPTTIGSEDVAVIVLPASVYITSAKFAVDPVEGFDDVGNTATLQLGLKDEDGTLIGAATDLDELDVADLTAGTWHTLSGSHIGASIGTAAASIAVTYGNEEFTQGKGKLLLEYTEATVTASSDATVDTFTPSVLFIGTSLVSNANRGTAAGTYHYTTVQSWIAWAQKFSNYRFECATWIDTAIIPGWEPSAVPGTTRGFWGNNTGVPGQTSEQIWDRREDIAGIPAKYVVLDMGTNDIGSALTAEEIHAYRVNMVEYLHSIGRRVILLPLLARDLATWPSGAGGLREKAVDVNQLTQDTYGSDGRITIYDWNAEWVDPGSPDGEPKTGASVDGTHFDGWGAYWVGKDMAENLFNNILPMRRDPYLDVATDLYDADTNTFGNILPSPTLTGTGGAVSGGATGVVADDYEIELRSGVAGVAGTKDGGVQVITITPPGAAGTTECYFRTDGSNHDNPLGGNWCRAGAYIEVVSGADQILNLRLHYQEQGGTTIYYSDGYQSATNVVPVAFTAKRYITPYMNLQAATTNARWRVEIETDDAVASPIVIRVHTPFAVKVKDPRYTYGTWYTDPA